MSLIGLLNGTATIERNAPAVSASGAVTESWSVYARNVRCTIQPATAREVQRLVGRELQADHMAYLEAGQPVGQHADGERLVDQDGIHYRVVGVSDAAGRSRLLVVALRRIV